MADLWNGQLFRFVLGFAVLYVAVAYATEAPLLIFIENCIAMSVAACVCVMYAPVLVGAMQARDPRKGDFLGAGIFFVSLSVFGMRMLSFVARDLGHPEVYNSDWTTAVISAGILGGLLHVAALYAREGGDAGAKWTWAGIVVGLSVFVCFATWNIHVAASHHPAIQLR